MAMSSAPSERSDYLARNRNAGPGISSRTRNFQGEPLDGNQARSRDHLRLHPPRDAIQRSAAVTERITRGLLNPLSLPPHPRGPQRR